MTNDDTEVFYSSASSASSSVVLGRATPTEPSESVSVKSQGPADPKAVLARRKALEAAVYLHIRAIRTMGRTSINTAEIADALAVSLDDVQRAISALKDKGVKVAG
jgi:hypothetical protein